MATWDKYTNEQGIEQIIRMDDDGTIWLVPNDPANSDYKAYLASLEEGEPKAE